MQRVVIRADASLRSGTGHIMRCLVLANELKQLGFQIHFISCEVPGNLCAQLVQCGYPVHQLSYLQTLDLDNYDQSGSTELWQKDLDQTREIPTFRRANSMDNSR